MLPFLVLVLLLCLVRRAVVPSRVALPARLPFGRRLLLALLIDVYLKLTEFQSGFGQVLLKLILSREQECAEVASIGSELCMHYLVRHGDAHAEWTGVMRWQLQMDGLSHSRRRRHRR